MTYQQDFSPHVTRHSPASRFSLRLAACLAGLIIGSGVLAGARAQNQAPAPAQPAPAQPAPTQSSPAQPAPAQPAASAAPIPAARLFTQEQLRKLLAPVALYSDSLLAQVLPASAYPIDIVSADRWLKSNHAAAAKGDLSGADAEDWDPSVKALLRFPSVLDRMNAEIDWTRDLGEAFVAQPQEVAAMIQTLRREAQAAGSLKSNKQQSVVTENQGGSDVVVIQDADPGMVYVPAYDPGAVYEPGSGALAAGLLTFGLGVATAAIINDNYWNWNAGWAYPGRWAGYPGYRPFNGANARVANVDVNNRWRPDPRRFHPSPRVQRALGNTPAGIARHGGAAQGGAATLPRAGLAGPRMALRPAARAARRPAARPRRSRVSHLSRRRVRAGPRLRAGRRFRGGVRRFGGGARRFRGGVHRFGGGARRFGGGARRLGGAVRRPIRRR